MLRRQSNIDHFTLCDHERHERQRKNATVRNDYSIHNPELRVDLLSSDSLGEQLADDNPCAASVNEVQICEKAAKLRTLTDDRGLSAHLHIRQGMFSGREQRSITFPLPSDLRNRKSSNMLDSLTPSALVRRCHSAVETVPRNRIDLWQERLKSPQSFSSKSTSTRSLAECLKSKVFSIGRKNTTASHRYIQQLLRLIIATEQTSEYFVFFIQS